MEISSIYAFAMVVIVSFVTISTQQTTEDPLKCNRTIDLIVLVDGSNSMGNGTFELVKNTIIEACAVLTYGENHARVGAVLFSSIVNAVVQLQTDLASFQAAVRAFRYPDEATFTNLAIDEATRILTKNQRKDVPMTILLVTDGEYSDVASALYAALNASSKGIDIWAVGIGERANEEQLANITTKGKNQTFMVESFAIFPDRLLNLTRLVCEVSEPQPTFTIPTTTTTSEFVGNTTIAEPITTTAMPPTTVVTPTENPDYYTELCKSSPSIGGVGYVLYPEDCTKLLQCYYNPHTNKTLVVIRQCPSGQFWDQTCLKCVDSWKVNCPYDKCKPESCSGTLVGLESYPMNGVCGGFWSCEKGRSYPKCCPPCYSYMAGYGCKFGNTCFDKCGPVEGCTDGIGVCDKIPDWGNITNYGIVTDGLGLYQTTCSQSDFSIVECKCQVKLRDTFMQDGEECKPYHESNSSLACTGAPLSVPIKHKTEIGTFAIRFSINLTEPNFDITSAPPSAQCDSPTKLRIWADSEGIHASIGDTSKGGVLTTVLFKNVTGDLEITTLLHQGLLTLGVRQDKFQYVSNVKVKSTRLCTDCIHNIVATALRGGCLLERIQLYNCKPEVTNIHVVD